MSQAIDEQGGHALGAAGRGVLDGHAEARHRAEQLVGVDIAANFAGSDGGLEQGAQGWPESAVEVARQTIVGRISGMQRLGEASLGCDKRRVSLHPGRQGLEGRMRLRQRRRSVGAGVDFTAEDRGDQIGALRKVSVKGAKANASLVGNLPHGGIDSRGRKDLLGREKQGIEAALCIRAHAPPRPFSRLCGDLRIFWLADHHVSLENGTSIHIYMER
jgi:hypothetical protein